MKKFRIFFCAFIAGIFCFTACQQVTEKYYVGCSYTVVFDSNGGTGKMKSQTFEQGKPQNLLKNSFVAPSGKIFAGWVLDSEDKQVLYTDNQVVNIEENCTLYAKWKMIEGSGTATETKKYKFVFDDWQTSDKNIKPGDDFYKFAAGRLFDGTGEGIESVLEKQEKDVNEFYKEQAKAPSFNLGKIAKRLKENLGESDLENALSKEISEIDEIKTLEDLYKKIAENLFVQNSAFIIYPEYNGREPAVVIGFGVDFDDSDSDDNTETEKSNDETDKKEAEKFYSSFKRAVPDKNWEKADSLAYKILNESLKNDIGEDLPELDFIKILDEISDGSEADSDLTLENAKEFLKFGAVQSSKIYNDTLEIIFKTQPFNYPVLKVYQEQNDSDGSARKGVLEICNEFRETFKSRIKRNTWMSETSKENAIKKADSMCFIAGYPENFPEKLLFEDFTSEFDNFIDFYKEISKKSVCEYIKRCLSSDSELSEEEKITDYFIFFDAPVTANAFYFPELNAVNICAPNLIKPFFDVEYAAAYNYAVLGASTVGHEMCHAFDNTGSQYDENGNRRDWWTVSDKLRYKEKQKEMETLFNQYMMDSGFTVNGEKTLGENMADYGGIVVAYETFLNKKSKEFTTEALTVQRKVFFQSYVLAWASLELDNEIFLQEDVHAPSEFRVKGPVSNMDDWYELYDVQYGDKYYLLPEQRIVLW